MNKRIWFWVKVVVLVGVMVLVGREVWKSWKKVQDTHMAIDWRWGPVAVACFCLNMLISALVWRWVAGRMGQSANQRISELANGGAEGRHALKGDGLSTWRLVGAYTFSQMGKYIPGKVGLLLMRIERAGRWGMGAGVTTLSTLLENALYVISGGLVGLVGVVRVLEELRVQGKISESQQRWQWVVILAAIVGLGVACSPAFFYGVVNRVLRKMKKAEVAVESRLGMGTLIGAVAGFVPCWVFGGVALWASTMCVHSVDAAGSWWFVGAFALSVIIGMVSLLPGGLGVRELVLGAAVTLQLSPVVGHDEAVLMGSAVAVLQRLFQVVAEVVMGGVGAGLTGGGELKIENSK